MGSNKITAVFFAAIVVSATFAFVTPAMAGTQIEVQPVAPVVTNVQCNQSSIDPDTYYNISFSLVDNNGINTTANITVKTWVNSTDEPSSGNNRTAYIFTWVNTTHAWTSDKSGYVDSDASTNVSALSGNSTTVSVIFKLNVTAVPTGAANVWEINVTVYDEDGLTDYDLNARAFDVRTYVSGTTTDVGVDFGTVNPGAATNYIWGNVTFTTNSNASINVTGANLERSTGETIPPTQFYVNGTNTGESGVLTQLGTTAVSFYTNYTQVEDSYATGVSGYNYNEEAPIQWNGTVPMPCRAGTYTGTWAIGIVAAEPQ